MKTRIITVLLTFALLILSVTPTAYAAYDPLVSKTTYYTEESDYIPGDCVLTATRMMIRRAAIMNGRTDWGRITNEALRNEITDFEGCLLYNCSYEAEGVKYTISCGKFSGYTDAERIAEFKSLLREHPEGIVVWGIGAANTGTHGVLVTDVVDGQVYVMDSSFNMGIFSEGIQRWEDSTMLDKVLVTDYWYLSDISADEVTVRETQVNSFHFKTLRARITTV